MNKHKIYIYYLHKLLIRYREALILFYISIKSEHWESAFSLLPVIENYEKRILQLIQKCPFLFHHRSLFNESLILGKKKYSLYAFLSKIFLLQKKINNIYQKKNHRIETYTKQSFYSKIDFLIKIFLQEKGL